MNIETKEELLIGMSLDDAKEYYPDLEITPAMEDGKLIEDSLEHLSSDETTSVEIQNNIITRVIEQ